MAEPTPQTFNHFSMVRFSPEYWRQSPDARQRIREAWLGAISRDADAVHVYQSFGPQADTDLLLWCACGAGGADRPKRFFTAFAEATAPARPYLTMHSTLWGFTRPSQYTKTRSTQEIDPFEENRAPYLVMYPFVKTAAWYLEDREARQAMMAEHIKIGKQYRDITQLLLYSFGLQDQEFVVVYETADLARFSSLVTDLRATKARVFTERDTPLHSGIHQPDVGALAAWL